MSEFETIGRDLGVMFATANESDAIARHRFATKLLVARVKAKKKGKEFDAAIGQACADAVQRSKPYSPAWVRLHCAAASRFLNEPNTAESAREFLEALNGHASRAKTPVVRADKTKAELLALVSKYIIRAVNDAGAVASEVERTMRDALAKAATPANGAPVRGAQPTGRIASALSA